MSDETLASIMEDAHHASLAQRGNSSPCYENGFHAGAVKYYSQGHSDGHLMGYKAGEKEGWSAAIEILKKERELSAGMHQTNERHACLGLIQSLIEQFEALKK